MSAWTRKIPVENADEALSEALSVARLSCLDDRDNLGMAMANLMNRIAGKIHASSTALACDHDCLRLGDGQFGRGSTGSGAGTLSNTDPGQCRTWTN